MKQFKLYLAAPFFTPEQLKFVRRIEVATISAGWKVFSPRGAPSAIELNTLLRERAPLPSDLREKVFYDNWSNIDDADIVLAVTDDFDSGVMWEIGYAFARRVPVITTTAKGYGSNLMLAQSTIGHTQSVEQFSSALSVWRDVKEDGEEDLKKLFRQKIAEGPEAEGREG